MILLKIAKLLSSATEGIVGDFASPRDGNFLKAKVWEHQVLIGTRDQSMDYRWASLKMGCHGPGLLTWCHQLMLDHRGIPKNSWGPLQHGVYWLSIVQSRFLLTNVRARDQEEHLGERWRDQQVHLRPVEQSLDPLTKNGATARS